MTNSQGYVPDVDGRMDNRLIYEDAVGIVSGIVNETEEKFKDKHGRFPSLISEMTNLPAPS